MKRNSICGRHVAGARPRGRRQPVALGARFAAALGVPAPARWSHYHFGEWSVAPTLPPDAPIFNLEASLEGRVEFL